MKKNKKTIIIGVGALIVTGIILAIVFIKKKKTSAAVNNVTTPDAPPVSACEPYTKAQRDAEKARLQANCSAMFLIPFIGPQKMAACLKGVDSKLRDVDSCDNR